MFGSVGCVDFVACWWLFVWSLVVGSVKKLVLSLAAAEGATFEILEISVAAIPSCVGMF